jgi:preprotein translocase subunit Sss1
MQEQEIIGELKNINSTLSGILEVMKKPQKNKVMQVFEVAGAGVGVLGIITIADIIRKWITGG